MRREYPEVWWAWIVQVAIVLAGTLMWVWSVVNVWHGRHP